MLQAGAPQSLRFPFYRRDGLAHLEDSAQPIRLEALGLGGPRWARQPLVPHAPGEERDTERKRGHQTRPYKRLAALTLRKLFSRLGILLSQMLSQAVHMAWAGM